MRVSLWVTAAATYLTLAIAPISAKEPLICKSGHLHYGGSEFHANRLQAEASAIDAWRRIREAAGGPIHADKMFPPKEQLHCARATTGEGWRCFVRGGPCHVS
jgi:hypothetical protein